MDLARARSAGDCRDAATLSAVDRFYLSRADLGPASSVSGSGPLISDRIRLRAPRIADAELILDLVNSPETGWRLPTAGNYVHPAEVVADITNQVAGFVIGEEIRTGDAVTLLALTAHSERNGVGEMSFYSLRRSLSRESGLSIEAAIVYLSFLFNGLDLRKVTLQVRDRDLAQFGPLPEAVVEREGLLKRQVKVGDSFEDVHLLAIWREAWLAIELDIGRFLAGPAAAEAPGGRIKE